MISKVSIRCQKNPKVGIRRIPAYTPQYTTVYSALSSPLASFIIASFSLPFFTTPIFFLSSNSPGLLYPPFPSCSLFPPLVPFFCIPFPYSLFFCILFLVARKWHLFVLLWPVTTILFYTALFYHWFYVVLQVNK